jgi:hypothetical protein
MMPQYSALKMDTDIFTPVRTSNLNTGIVYSGPLNDSEPELGEVKGI